MFRRYDLSVLFVCTANLCRSPMAEGILRFELQNLKLSKRIKVASAGTHVSQSGSRPDARAIAVCEENGISIKRSRTRQLISRDFDHFDFILAMDQNNLKSIKKLAGSAAKSEIAMLGQWDNSLDPTQVIDPYFGNRSSFYEVFSRLESLIASFVIGALKPAIV